MTTDHRQVNPEQARQQLDASRHPRLTTGRDRTVHAVGTAVVGIAVALFMASQNVVEGTARTALMVLFVVVCGGSGVAVERVARTVPRRARLRSRLGIGATFVLALVAALPWLNLRAQDEPNTWAMVVVAAALVAVPSVVAAAVIAREPR